MIADVRRLVRLLAVVGRRFRRDNRGNVAIIFGFASVVLLVTVGAGMDLSRAYFTRQKLSEVATLTCQYAMRPSAVNAGANAFYTTGVNQYANSQLTAQNWPANAMPTGGPNGTSSAYFTSTGAGVGSNKQEPTGVAELWYNMPTSFMSIVNINQITVHAVMNCQPPAPPTPSTTPGTIVLSEGFETGKPSYYFTNPSGQTAALSSPLNTFPLTAGYQGDGGSQFYIMGYCLEIDLVGVINSSTPQGTHSAELDCDNGSGSSGNSSLSTKTYLPVGYYELRYNYRSRVDYPNYDPTYICGSTASDVAWANDTAGSYGTRTNEINVYFDQSVGGAAPPLHTTLDGSQQLAGSNMIDVCLYGPNWVERSVKIKVTTAGYYWLSFAADGHNDSYGGQLDNIRLCVEQCNGTLQDNFPTSWTANLVLFEDPFAAPTYAASPYAQVQSNNLSNSGNLANSAGVTTTCPATSVAAPPGWPCQAATGWATAPYNQVNYYSSGAYQGSQYIAIDGNNTYSSGAASTNRLISRPFILDPGYYQVSYDYIANVNLPAVTTVFCTAAPASGYIYSASSGYANMQGQPRYGTSSNNFNPTTSILGVFMSHGMLVSTPNVANAPWAVSDGTTYGVPALGAATTYTNPTGTFVAPDAVNWAAYNSAQSNPVIDTCGYAPNYQWQVRSVSIKITKAGVYWLTFSSNGGVADGFGPGIDDVKLTALGSPYMSNPPVISLVTIPTPAPASGSNYTNNGSFSGFYIVADPFTPPAADQ